MSDIEESNMEGAALTAAAQVRLQALGAYDLPCLVCHTTHWEVEHSYMWDKSMDGIVEVRYPVILMTCETCGYEMRFDPSRLLKDG